MSSRVVLLDRREPSATKHTRLLGVEANLVCESLCAGSTRRWALLRGRRKKQPPEPSQSPRNMKPELRPPGAWAAG